MSPDGLPLPLVPSLVQRVHAYPPLSRTRSLRVAEVGDSLMARQYAPLFTSIWNDRDFTALPSDAQRLYMLAFSQPNVSWAGVVPFTEKRWASLAPDTTIEDVRDAVDDLTDAGFVLLDADTEELWVRGFVKANRILEQPNLRKALVRALDEVMSPTIRWALYDSLPDDLKEQVKSPPEPVANPSAGRPEGIDRTRCIEDLDLNQHKYRESPVDPTGSLDSSPPTSALELLAAAKRGSHGAEVDQHVAALVSTHGAEAVECAVQAVADQLAGKVYAWPSDVRKALEAELGSAAKPNPLDSTAAADRVNQAAGVEYTRQIEALPIDPNAASTMRSIRQALRHPEAKTESDVA